MRGPLGLQSLSLFLRRSSFTSVPSFSCPPLALPDLAGLGQRLLHLQPFDAHGALDLALGHRDQPELLAALDARTGCGLMDMVVWWDPRSVFRG